VNWYERAKTAEREIARLKSIVDRIPKFADGSPALPGDEAWHPRRDHSGIVLYRYADDQNCQYADFKAGHTGVLKKLNECYPTREAMEESNV